ncbi:MAG TPA: hypothetical protein VMD74_02515, partial [Candidatus Methylomirabilis sp.]|nr:hypothetical protein [Candidatus Methylomirabilis sp.]
MKKDRGDMYQKLGVDSGKGNVREIFSRIIKNDFPGAWVNIVRDPDDPNFVLTGHNDGDGSKFLQRLLHYLETGGDYRVFKGVLDDGLIMNGADIGAAGFVYGIWLVTDFLNVALPPKIKEDVMRAIAERAEELMKIFADNDLSLKFFFLGGETADLPNQVRSGVFDVSIAARMRAENVITGKVQPGDIIFGLRSDGMAAWEKRPNSGLMSNGSTLGRSCLMSRQYNRKYPFLAKRTIDFSARPFYKQALPFLWPVESCNFFKG